LFVECDSLLIWTESRRRAGSRCSRERGRKSETLWRMGNGCFKVAAGTVAAPVVVVVGTGVVLGVAAQSMMGLASGHVGTDHGKNSINDRAVQRRMILETQKSQYYQKKMFEKENRERHHDHILAQPDVDYADTRQYHSEREAFATYEAMKAREATARNGSPCEFCGAGKVRGLCVCHPKGVAKSAAKGGGGSRKSSVDKEDVRPGQGRRGQSFVPRRTALLETMLPPIRDASAGRQKEPFGRSRSSEHIPKDPPPKVEFARGSSVAKPDPMNYLRQSAATDALEFLGPPKPIFARTKDHYPKPHLSSWDS